MKWVWIFVLCIGPCISEWPKCEKINTAHCQGLGYNTTMMPNFVGHKTMADAEKGVSIFKFYILIVRFVFVKKCFNMQLQYLFLRYRFVIVFIKSWL